MNDNNIDDILNSVGLEPRSVRRSRRIARMREEAEEANTTSLPSFEDIFGDSPSEAVRVDDSELHGDPAHSEATPTEHSDIAAENFNDQEFTVSDGITSQIEAVPVPFGRLTLDDLERVAREVFDVSAVPSQESGNGHVNQLSDNDFQDILGANGFGSPDDNYELGPDQEDEPIEEQEEEDDDLTILDDEDDDGGDDEVVEEETLPDPNELPANSNSLLIEEATSRFSGTEWFEEIQKTRIILAGLGGIGSNVAFQLARMSPAALVLYDDDIVEAANLSGQLFNRDNAGMFKVYAITSMISSYTTASNVFAVSERFTEASEAGDIMICGFDNMSARRIFFESWKRHVYSKPEEERKKCVFIDGRLSIDTLQVLCVQGNEDKSIERYESEFLFEDSEADETVCSRKQTTYIACMIGSVIVNIFTNWVASSLDPVIPYDVPFFTEYDAQNMIFKTVS